MDNKDLDYKGVTILIVELQKLIFNPPPTFFWYKLKGQSSVC